MKEKWICTDSDCSQYCKVNQDGTYSFIEKVWLDICRGDPGYPDKHYTVKTALVDLNDYTEHEKECNISGYYDSLETLREFYTDDSDQVIAECIFEEMTEGSVFIGGKANENLYVERV